MVNLYSIKTCQRVINGVLIFSLVWSPSFIYAQSAFVSTLPEPGAMVAQSSAFVPVLLKGMTLYSDNPLRFDFIVDSGNTKFTPEQVKQESNRLVKYFLAAMTVPQNDLWVNLSPYEADRIIPDALGKTELGQDMLAQDYLLKQLSASLLDPEKDLGKEFWARVYKQAQEKFGVTEIPVDIFNKVWIMPEEATIYENGKSVYVINSRLKVMLDRDYRAMQINSEGGNPAVDPVSDSVANDTAAISSQITREILLPEITREVNEGKNFASIRQIYQALILAKWYKDAVKESFLSKIYIDQKKIKGVDLLDPTVKDQIYGRYVEAFQKGVINLIKEDYDVASQQTVPRKYFSGGEIFGVIPLKRAQDAGLVNASVVGDSYKIALRIEPQKEGGDRAMTVNDARMMLDALNASFSPVDVERAVNIIVNNKKNRHGDFIRLINLLAKGGVFEEMAIVALGKFGDIRAISYLADKLNGGNIPLRQWAMSRLTAIEKQLEGIYKELEKERVVSGQKKPGIPVAISRAIINQHYTRLIQREPVDVAEPKWRSRFKLAVRWAMEEMGKYDHRLINTFGEGLGNRDEQVKRVSEEFWAQVKESGKRFIVYSGGSGVGKSAMLDYLRTQYRNEFEKFVIFTTREPRDNERDGIDYHFRTREQLLELRDRGEVQVFDMDGLLQGFSFQQVEGKIANPDKITILECTPEMALAIRDKFGDKIEIFFVSPFNVDVMRAIENDEDVSSRKLLEGLSEGEFDDLSNILIAYAQDESVPHMKQARAYQLLADIYGMDKYLPEAYQTPSARQAAAHFQEKVYESVTKEMESELNALPPLNDPKQPFSVSGELASGRQQLEVSASARIDFQHNLAADLPVYSKAARDREVVNTSVIFKDANGQPVPGFKIVVRTPKIEAGETPYIKLSGIRYDMAKEDVTEFNGLRVHEHYENTYFDKESLLKDLNIGKIRYVIEALRMTGFIPDGNVTLAAFLNKLDHHVEIDVQSFLPPQSGMGGSVTLAGSLIYSLLKSTDRFDGHYTLGNIALYASLMEMNLGSLGGWQDAFLTPGLHYLNIPGGQAITELGDQMSQYVPELKQREELVAALESHIVLYYSGGKHIAADILGELFKGYLRRDEHFMEVLQRGNADLARSKELFKEFSTGPSDERKNEIIAEVAELAIRAGKQFNEIVPGVISEEMKTVFDDSRIKDLIHGFKFMGAGGSGFVAVFVKDSEDKDKVIKVLNDIAIERARVLTGKLDSGVKPGVYAYTMNTSETGLKDGFNPAPAVVQDQLDVVDKDDNVKGSMGRDDVHKKGARHRSVTLLPVDQRTGKIVFQKRARTKKNYPELFDIFGMQVLKSKTYDETRNAIVSEGLAGIRDENSRRVKEDGYFKSDEKDPPIGDNRENKTVYILPIDQDGMKRLQVENGRLEAFWKMDADARYEEIKIQARKLAKEEGKTLDSLTDSNEFKSYMTAAERYFDIEQYVFMDIDEALERYKKEPEKFADGFFTLFGNVEYVNEIKKSMPLGLPKKQANMALDESSGDHAQAGLESDVGGIDMNRINVSREGNGSDVKFNPVAVQDILNNGIDGFAPVIINITPIESPLLILGVNADTKFFTAS